MAQDRRSLLRRELLKEQLQREQTSSPVAQPSSTMSVEEANLKDRELMGQGIVDALPAFGTGVAQGATFGFSDELGAAADVAGAALGGQGVNLSDTSSLYDKWRKFQQQRESQNKTLEEESPAAYLSGELTGGIGSAALMPGIGTANIAKGAASVSPKLAAFLSARAPASGLTKIAGKATAGLIEGAPIGAAYGIGSSEATIEQPKELMKDAASSAAMGSLTGLALGGAAQGSKEAFKYGKEFVKDSDFLRQAGKAYDYGSEKGINLGSSKAQDQLSRVPTERADELTSRIFQIDAEIGKTVGDSLKKASEQGIKINIDPELQSAGERLTTMLFIDNPTLGQLLDPKSTKLLKTIAQHELGDLNPVEAKALRDELYNLRDKLTSYPSDQANFAKGLGSDVARALDMNLKGSIPEYAAAARQFEEFRRMVPETIISQGTPAKYQKTFLGDLKNPELKLLESSESMLKKATLPGESAVKGRQTLEQLRLNLQELQKSQPKAVEQMGGSAEQVASGLKGQADELAMIRQAQGFDPQEGPKGLLTGAVTGLITTGRGLTISGVNKLGLLSKTAGQTAPVQMSVNLFKTSNDKLGLLAQKLKAEKATALLGDALEGALANKNDVAKNAVLFKLMQNPDYRALLKSEGLDDGSKQ